jgi:ribosome maturation factor RimP
MVSNKKLEDIVLELISDDQSLFLVDVEIKGNEGNLTVVVHLDGDAGIDIDKCGQISREMGDILEENELIESKYRLEVSSPGIDQPIKLSRQYQKNIGRDFKLETLDGEQFKGKLIEVLKDTLVFNELSEQPKRPNKYSDKKVSFSLNNISKAKVLISFT